MKRFSTVILTLLLIASLAFPAFAADNVAGIDFTPEQDEEINQLSDSIMLEYGIEAFMAWDMNISGSDATLQLAKDTVSKRCTGEDFICLAVTKDLYYFYSGGLGSAYLNKETKNAVWSAMSGHSQSYYEYVKAYYNELDIVMATMDVESISFTEPQPEAESAKISVAHDLLIDDADLLTDSEENELEEKLSEISERQSFDVVVLTVDSLDGKTAEEYADDYYDENGYGQGDGKDGCLFLISMEDRDWHLSTCGYGITAITDYGIDCISELVVPSLSSGEYADAFSLYADCVDDFINESKNGSPYDYNNELDGYYNENGEFVQGRRPRRFRLGFLIAGAVIGLISAAIATSASAAKLKSVASKTEANDYLIRDSFVLTGCEDKFIRSNLMKSPIPRDTGTKGGMGGGSSVHMSGSGMSHGGGGGKF